MSSEYGRIVSVEVSYEGDVLASAINVGATSIPVEDVLVFDEDGGRALLGPNASGQTEVVTYSEFDPDTATTLTLGTGTTYAYEVECTVSIYPEQRMYFAQVLVDEETDDALVATVPHSLLPLLPLGFRTEDDGEAVECELRGSDWYVKDILGKGADFVDPNQPSTPESVTLTLFRREVSHRHVWAARAKWAAVTTDVMGKTIAPELYDVQLVACDSGGTPIEVDGAEYDDWRTHVPADSDNPTRHTWSPLPKPRTYYYKVRVRAMNRKNGGKCWSSWSSFTSPQLATDEALPGPPAPTGLATWFKKDAPAGNPWRQRVRWNELGDWTPTNGDLIKGAVSYIVHQQVSATENGTVMRNHRIRVPAEYGGGTAEHSFNNIRARRWYRVRVRAVDKYGNLGTYTDWTAWARPRSAPNPPASVNVSNPTARRIQVGWTPPTDEADIDRYKVLIYRYPSWTLIDTLFVARGTHRVNWHISDAEHSAYPNATYRARVHSVEQPYSTEVDETPGEQWESDGDSSYVETDSQQSTSLWTADDIDTGTLPPNPSDGDPPASSPTPSALGSVGCIYVKWGLVENTDPVFYEVHMSSLSDFTCTSNTLAGVAQGGSFTIRAHTAADGDGTPLRYGVTYYIKLVAYDVDGAAASSSQASTSISAVGGGNLVGNSSMEERSGDWGTMPDHMGTYSWQGAPTWVSYGRTNAEYYDRNYSCKLQWSNGTDRQGMRIDCPPYPNMYFNAGYYVFSAWLRTNVAPDAIFGPGDFNVEDAQWLANPTPNINAWQRWAKRFRVDTPNWGGLYISSGSSSGEMYVDGVQLEYGMQPTAYAPRVASDGHAPTSSPTPVLHGGVGYIAVEWSPVRNDDPVTYEVHVHPVSDFTPSTDTLNSEVTGCLAFVKLNYDGEPLKYFQADGETPQVYYVKLVAKDEDGSASPSGNGVGTSMVQADGVDIAAGSITAGHILAGTMSTQNLGAVGALINNLVCGNAETNRVEVDAQGLRVINDDNVTLINFPTIAGGRPYINGDLVAQSLEVIGATFLGETTIAKGTDINLQSTVVAPSTTPNLAIAYPTNAAELKDGNGVVQHKNWFGLGYTANGGTDGNTPCFYTSVPNSNGYWRYIEEHRASDGVWLRTYSLGNNDDDCWGVTCIGGYMFVLFKRADQKDYWLHRIRISDWAFMENFDLGIVGGSYIKAMRPGIGSDGTYVYVIGANNQNSGAYGRWSRFLWSDFTDHGTHTHSAMLYDCTEQGSNRTTEFGGMIKVGSNYYLATYSYDACTRVHRKVYAFTGNPMVDEGLSLVTDEDFPGALGEEADGVAYVGSNFYTVLDGGTMTKHTNWTWTSATSDTVWGGFTWRDNTGSDPDTATNGYKHETTISPRSSVTMRKRAGLRMSMPSVFPGTGGDDDPNTRRVYITMWGTDPGSGGLRLQATTTDSSYLIESFANVTADPTTQTFPAGTPATITPQATDVAKLQANGDGFMPVGAILAYGGSAAPQGWFLCQGQTNIVRNDYPHLFAVIGTAYGAVDGDHFTLPDLQARGPMGYKSTDTAFDALGETGGEKSHTLTLAEMPSHEHGQATSAVLDSGGDTIANPGAGSFASWLASHNHQSKGSDAAHNVLDPYQVVNFIIRHD